MNNFIKVFLVGLLIFYTFSTHFHKPFLDRNKLTQTLFAALCGLLQ